MVLKKPYAFLIRHFKLIHLLLCIPLVYLIIRTGAITSFLNSYVSANYYTSEMNLGATYINYFMYLAIILVLVLVLAIFFLMRQKKKDTRFYLFLLLYYLLLFILITVCHSILDSIEDASITAQTVRGIRDVAFIVYLPQFFFTLYCALRGIGFDIKKFNFDEDAKEMEITDIDDEEFELVFGKDAYKYKRTLRRFIREFKYYVLENKAAFAVLASMVVIAIGTILYLNFNVYHKTYRQTQRMTHNNLSVSVEKSILTKLDLGGNELSTYYLALAVHIRNNGRNAASLDYDNFQIDVANRMIQPTLDRSTLFPDLGLPYTRSTQIGVGEEDTYVLVYEIDESLIQQKMTLKILDSLTFEIGSVTPIYKTVNLNYETINETKQIREVDFDKILELSGTSVGLTQIQIHDFEVMNSYEYSYQSCTNGVCQDLKNKVTSSSGRSLLVLDRMFQLDTYSTYYHVRKGASSFVNDFVKVRYVANNQTITTTVTDVTPKEVTDKWVFDINSSIANATRIDLLVNLRGDLYVLRVK